MCGIYSIVERFMKQILISAAGHASVLISKWRCVLCGHCFMWSQSQAAKGLHTWSQGERATLEAEQELERRAKCLRERCLLWTLKPMAHKFNSSQTQWVEMRNLGLRCENLTGVADSSQPGCFPEVWAQGKARKRRSQILSWKPDPSTPFLCIPGWERSFMSETEGTHKMWFKVAISGVLVTSPWPRRPSQAGFLIRAVGRSCAGALLAAAPITAQGRPHLRSPGPLTLNRQSLSSTDLMGQNMSFRLKQNFWTWESIYFLPEKAHLKWPSTVFIHSFILHSYLLMAHSTR